MVFVIVAVGLAVWSLWGQAAPSSPAHASTGMQQARPSVTVSMARWKLPDALSRESAAPLPGRRRILLLGGLFGSGASSADVSVLDTSTGRLTSVGALSSPTHDAASSVLDSKVFLFGGGQGTPFSLVQEVPLSGAANRVGSAAAVTGQLPGVRADGEAVTVGRAAYVVGGWDGSRGDAAVLVTTNGSAFSPVVTLPVAVRYPAVTAAHGTIYVFGGESQQGGTTAEYSTPAGSATPPAGQQVAVVQAVDLQRRGARVVGYLPHGLQGATALVLGGHIFLAGGDSYPPGANPRSGSTVWSFDPTSDSFHVAGHLAAPVAYAAAVVEGGTAWLVGGERDGTPVASVQRVAIRGSP